MKVLLSAFIAGGRTGIPRYAIEVSRAIDAVAPEFDDLQISLATTPAGAESIAARNLGVRVVGMRLSNADRAPIRLALEQLHVRGRPADLVHYFDFVGPWLGARGLPYTTTLHDLKFITNPDAYTASQRLQKRVMARRVARTAARVVAISKFAGDEAVDILSVAADRVRVIHSGPGFTPASGDVVASPVPGEYLLCVGTLSSTKNVPFLIAAYERSGVSQPLVLAGGRAPGFEDVERAIAASSCQERIVVISGASDGEIDALYRGATALLLPSRYEGFGFTPLEAMSRSCPVLASDIPVVREISGDGAWLLPLDDLETWAEALRAIVSDDRLRSTLRAAGSQTVLRYSWEKTARALCELFREVGLNDEPRARRYGRSNARRGLG